MNSLLFDGQRIADDQTAADLDMEEGDAIEVLLERTLRHHVTLPSLSSALFSTLNTPCISPQLRDRN